MKEEQIKKLDETFLIDSVRKTYISKEQFISMIEGLDFLQIKEARLHFITGFRIKIDDKDNKIVETLGFDIDIDID